jgi:hypothetical protein
LPGLVSPFHGPCRCCFRPSCTDTACTWYLWYFFT